jgi:hypothetical protein
MSKQRYEYRVAFVDFRGRVSIEGEETLIQEGERMTAFGRRFLNALGEQGWELVDVQMQHGGNAFHIFKRPLAEGETAEPAKPIEQTQAQPGPGPQPFTRPFPGAGPVFGYGPGPMPGGMMFEHPVSPMHAGHPGDVFIRFVQRGPDDPTPREFRPPEP